MKKKIQDYTDCRMVRWLLPPKPRELKMKVVTLTWDVPPWTR